MKQSSGRASIAYLSCRTAVFGLAAMLAGAAAVSGCRSNNNTPCPNLPQATALIGQTSYNSNAANVGGISAATLGSPQGSVATNETYFYVADTGNNRVLGYSSVPTGTGAAASFVIGQPDFKSVAPGEGTTGLSLPSKVSISDTGSQLIVVDSGNNRVLIWNTLPTPTANNPPDVVIGQPDFNTTSDQPNQGLSAPTNASLSDPTGATIANGHLVVVDKNNNRVLIWNSVVGLTNGQAADVELGQAATSSTNGNCTSNAGYCFTTNITGNDTFSATTNSWTLGMDQPTDVWTDGRRLAISDTTNNRVLYWSNFPNTQNALPTNLFGVSKNGTGFGAPGSGSEAFNAPTGLGSDSNYLYVADTGNNRVLQFTLAEVESNGPPAVGVWGQQDFGHDTANDPDQNGQVGDQRNNPPTNGVTQSTLDGPTGVYADPVSGLLYITDSANERVLVFPISSGVNGTYTNLC
jgi:hypothetical protein